MATTIEPNMNLTIPGVLSEPGPDYAVEVNADLVLIGSHDHTTGKGVRVPVAGLNINADLPVNVNNLNNARSYRMNNSPNILNGGADINEIYTFNGNLYYNNSSGTPIKITNSSAVNSTNTFYSTKSVFADYTISTTETFVYYEVDSHLNTVNITLPAASLVPSGRFYFFKDIDGSASTNAITITANGFDNIDGAASIVLSRNYEIISLVCDGAQGWYLQYGALKDWLQNNFGVTGQFANLVGSGITIQADTTGTISIGNTANALSFNGATYTFGFNSGNTFNVNAATSNINGANLNINCTGTATFNCDLVVAVGNNLVVNGGAIFNQNVVVTSQLSTHTLVVTTSSIFVGDPNIEHNCTIGTTSADTLIINASSIFNSPSSFPAEASFANNVVLGTNSSNTLTVNSLVNFDSQVNLIGTSILAAPMTSSGSGRVVKRIVAGSTGSTQTYSINTVDIIYLSNISLPNNVTWTLSNTGAQAGDVIEITFTNVDCSSNTFLLKNAGGSTVYAVSVFAHNYLAYIRFDGTSWTGLTNFVV